MENNYLLTNFYSQRNQTKLTDIFYWIEFFVRQNFGGRQDMETMDRLFDDAGRDYYPAWVCLSCGVKYGRRHCGIACWHVGTCGICGIEASVTEPRDFGHLQNGWRERYKQEASNDEY